MDKEGNEVLTEAEDDEEYGEEGLDGLEDDDDEDDGGEAITKEEYELLKA
mgnify:FL=1